MLEKNNHLMKKMILLSLIIASTCWSCFPTRQLNLQDFSTEIISLPFQIDSLRIVDQREDLLPMNWNVPLFPSDVKQWNGNPEFSERNRRDITRIIKQSEKLDGVPAYIEYRVLEGECRLSQDWKAPQEYAKFKGEIILEIPSRNYTYTSYAEMYYDSPALNGTESNTIIMFNQAVKNVTHMMLKQIRDEITIE